MDKKTRESLNEKIARVIDIEYELQKFNKESRGIRDDILKILQKNNLKEFETCIGKAIRFAPRIFDLAKTKEILKNYWRSVVSKEIKYKISLEAVENLLKKGKISEEDYKRLFTEPKDILRIIEK